mmetsp:Transcript_16280/g.53196  ORF Transcript_16280/g.53196 Transcript_16280/m.53196 type:complete len:208 (+) Transcript_16280:2-625(+)
MSQDSSGSCIVPEQTLAIPCNPSQLQEGDIVCNLAYASFVGYITENNIRVAKLRDCTSGDTFKVPAESLSSWTCASYFSRTKVVTRSELVKVLRSASHFPFQNTFTRKAEPKLKDLEDLLEEAYGNSELESAAKRRKLCKELRASFLEGKEKTLSARLFIETASEDFGRIYVQDLENCPPDNVRLVDTRTISSFVINGVQFKVKTRR